MFRVMFTARASVNLTRPQSSSYNTRQRKSCARGALLVRCMKTTGDESECKQHERNGIILSEMSSPYSKLIFFFSLVLLLHLSTNYLTNEKITFSSISIL